MPKIKANPLATEKARFPKATLLCSRLNVSKADARLQDTTLHTLLLPLPGTTSGNYSYAEVTARATEVRQVRKVWTFALMALLLAPQSTWKTATWKQEELLAFEPVVELMEMIASAGEAERETVATALTAFMEQLTSFLKGQGVPAETLDRLIREFSEAQEEFLGDRVSADEFGERVAALARKLQAEAEEQGVQGLPEKLLEEIGLDPETIEALRTEADLDPEEIVEIAERIAEENAAPEDEVPPEEGPPPDETEPPGDEAPPDEGPPPDDSEPAGDEAPPPDDNPPPDDSGPPADEPPPDDSESPDDEPPPDDSPPPDDPGPPPEDEVPPEDTGP